MSNPDRQPLTFEEMKAIEPPPPAHPTHHGQCAQNCDHCHRFRGWTERVQARHALLQQLLQQFQAVPTPILKNLSASLVAAEGKGALVLPIGLTLKAVRNAYLLASIEAHGGNVSLTSRTLNVARRTILNWITEIRAEAALPAAPLETVGVPHV